MAIKRKPEEAPAEVRALAEKLEDFVIEHSLMHARIRSPDGEWFVTVEEPWLYDDPSRLKITYEEFDL